MFAELTRDVWIFVAGVGCRSLIPLSRAQESICGSCLCRLVLLAHYLSKVMKQIETLARQPTIVIWNSS